MSTGNSKGIGLIEIIIAILIFGLGIAAAIRTLPDSSTATNRARNLSVASNLAQERLEALMGVPFSSADLTAGRHFDPGNPLERRFTRSWLVSDNVPVSGMKQVSVTVSFNSGSPDSSVTVSTYLTSRR